MAFSTTMLAWSVLEFGKFMDSDRQYALEAIRWATDYFLKATSVPGFVYVQVGDPYGDHNCWERPEDMDTPRTPYAVSKNFPGSEVSAELAAALAASSMVFRPVDRDYSARLLKRARMVFEFADQYRGSYNDSLGPWVCPFYCDFSGYEDELIWGAAWLYKATRAPSYWLYVVDNIHNLENSAVKKVNSISYSTGGSFAEFGWDSKHAGINILVSKWVLNGSLNFSPFIPNADKFVCSILPESPTVSVSFSPGGLLFKPGGSNLQHATALSFLLVVYARYLNQANRVINCGNVVAKPSRLVQVARSQVDYILGSNPLNMSYMVGYGNKFPQKIHHRGSSIPSIDQRPDRIDCNGGTQYFLSSNPNPSLLIGAVVGGPDMNDSYSDSRADFAHSEPTTYINAPLVGLLACFKGHPSSLNPL
ncbi:putative endo-1 4-beta-glucanase [Tripterygium wilfordii]|uniref:Endoglucanase n=2 Tax=Tripterygium wilfordii TaxID=458696 RepID=A0A7J7CAD2_TRIWF|nr:putative endo-1 4-beta-glucanase [Tripterygium wilfordii]